MKEESLKESLKKELGSIINHLCTDNAIEYNIYASLFDTIMDFMDEMYNLGKRGKQND